VIRGATRADAEAIAQIHTRAWRHNYDGIVDAAQLDSLDVELRTQQWVDWLDKPGVQTLVEEVDGRLAGFTAIEGDMLRALYVDPPAQGAGAGSRLLAAAQDAGARRLDVFSANGHARGFYERRGWRDAGDAGEHRGLPVRRYVR
jgi:GNAT superfamily N-acetyltransferase